MSLFLSTQEFLKQATTFNSFNEPEKHTKTDGGWCKVLQSAKNIFFKLLDELQQMKKHRSVCR